MKSLFKIIVVVLLILLSCKESTDSVSRDEKTIPSVKNDFFELTYIYAGLGSNMNSKQPVFKVIDDRFIYTLEENSSWNGEYTKIPDTICVGIFRMTSSDSISQIIQPINDTLIYETSENIIMSGGIDEILINNAKKKLVIRLHNASHPTAQAIIDIINSNIPNQFNKINLWEDSLGTRTKTNINWTDLGAIEFNEK